MASLPYVTAPGNVTKALNAIITAATPEKVTQDFVKEVLKITGSSGNQMTSFLKKIGMAGPDGTPTEMYRKFRNEATRSVAAVAALNHGYSGLYKRNEYMHNLSDSRLKGLILEETGVDAKNAAVKLTAKCIQGIMEYVNSNTSSNETEESKQEVTHSADTGEHQSKLPPHASQQGNGIGMNLSYTINLNLPATSDIAVFNAIFRSLKENLLSVNDG